MQAEGGGKKMWNYQHLPALIRPVVVGRTPAARSGRRAAAVGPGIRGLRRCSGTGGGTPSAPGLGGVCDFSGRFYVYPILCA